MSTLTDEISRRRTFAIISHPDAGKTTLTEKLLLFGGAIHIAGAVKSNKIKKTATDEDIKTALERVGLKSDLKVKKFSLGMKQRLNIAQAVFEKQKIILLDEPTNALDNDGVQLIYKLLKEEKERGALVVITTHHKEDLEEVCDVVLKMTEGELHEK